MTSRDNSSEEAAAQAVARVLGGEWTMNDTGKEPGQYDVHIATTDERSIALEVTGFGGDDWRRTRDRVEKEQARGTLEGRSLRHQWWVVFRTGAGVRDLQPRLEEVLSRLEAKNIEWATTRYNEDDDVTLREVAAVFAGAARSLSQCNPM